uniref:Uncharacterized protein n=1 Tax=Oryza brachyantha TaxID=4533 RepID=J3MZQ1_ORYBR
MWGFRFGEGWLLGLQLEHVNDQASSLCYKKKRIQYEECNFYFILFFYFGFWHSFSFERDILICWSRLNQGTLPCFHQVLDTICVYHTACKKNGMFICEVNGNVAWDSAANNLQE